MNRSPPSQVMSWKRSRHGGIVRSSRSIHLLSSTASTYRRTEYGVRQVAVYVMLAYDVNGHRMSLASGSTRRRASMPGCRSPTSRARGVKDLGILSMDGVSGLEEGAKAVFPCHGSKSSHTSSAIPSATSHASSGVHSRSKMKLIYGAINVKQARQEFEKFKTDWQAYPGAVSVWENNFSRRAAL